jgi:hypothetical protein
MADTLLKDAIADAKAVRETALANAKLALQEAFTPKLQSMLSARLKNEMEGDFDKEGEEEVPTGLEDTENEIDPTVAKEETDVTASSGKDPEKEKAGDVGTESGSNTAKSTKDTLGKTTIEEEGEEEFPVGDEEEDGLNGDSITSEAEEIPIAGEEDEVPEDEDNVELEAIIKELEAEDEVPVEEPALGDEEVPTEEATDVTADAGQDTETELAGDVGPESGSDAATVVAPTTGTDSVEGEEELDLESLVKEIEDEMGDEESEEEKEKAGQVEFENLRKENTSLKKSIKEHRDVIVFMRGKLNETNLLNAKLLYTNKLFRSNTLSESQKVRVLEALDRANSIREAKLVYSTLAEALKIKKPLTEIKKKDKGSASKSTGTTKPSTEILSEGADIRKRFQRLAGVKGIKKFL